MMRKMVRARKAHELPDLVIDEKKYWLVYSNNMFRFRQIASSGYTNKNYTKNGRKLELPH